LLHAAVDSEFRMETDKEKNIILTNTKSKESELLPPMAFHARGVKLLAEGGGYILNEDGEPETSAILEQVDYELPTGETGLGKNQERILEILRGTEEGNMEAGDLLTAFKERTGKTRDAFNDAELALEERDLIFRNIGFIYLGKSKKGINV
jgi:hypothetical protein